MLEICGNNILDAGEQCDDGNTVSGDGCSQFCTIEICGNGILDLGEQCDDGNNVSGDGCSPNCRLEICGNNILESNEECDGEDSSACEDRCSQSCTCLFLSSIRNPAGVDVTGTLTMRLDKKVGSDWISKKQVINREITIPANGYVKLGMGEDNLGQPILQGWNLRKPYVYADESGNYRIFVSFDTYTNLIEKSYEFVVGRPSEDIYP